MAGKDLVTTLWTNRSKHSRWRYTSIVALVAMVPMSLLPPGCAATDDSLAVQAPQPPVVQTLGPAIEADLQTCMKNGVAQLERHSYHLSFEVEATREGAIGKIESKGDKLDDPTIEACIEQVLKRLPVSEIVQIDEAFPRTSQSVVYSPSSRNLIGNATTVLPNVIRLAPILITAPGGITLVVAVSIVVVAAVAVGRCQRSVRRSGRMPRSCAKNCCVRSIQSVA